MNASRDRAQDRGKDGQRQPPFSASGSYLTSGQVAALLQVSERTILRLVKADASMPVLKVGRLVRFPMERLEAWLAARSQGMGRRRRSGKPSAGEAEGLDSPGNSGAAGRPCAALCAETER